MRRSSLLLWFGLLACACTHAAAPAKLEPARAVTARPWPEADALFTHDPAFRGGDAAISVALGAERVLWLFGDSFVAREASNTRAEASFVHNSVAIQEGRDPVGARFRFVAGHRADGAPASFFADEAEAWVWPGDGVYLDHVLTVFLERMRKDAASALGFRSAGWTAARIANADDDPGGWRVEPLATPDTGTLGIVGASLLHDADHVIAYAVEEPGSHDVKLLRWSRAEFERGALLEPEYFLGTEVGWGRGPPATVIAGGATEFSVTRLGSGRYVQVQSRGFGPAPIAVRFASRAEGPFGPAFDAYLPPEAAQPKILLYAARAHPELPGAELVLTYASNTLDPARLVADAALYYPRFVRIDLR